MKTEDFNYDLPEKYIAQTPLSKRDNSKMLVLNKKTGSITHKHFSDIVDYLSSNDVLVLNDTKVIPARLMGVKESTGAIIEILILKNLNDNIYECLSRPAKRVHVGDIISFGEGLLKAKCTEIKEDGIRHFEFIYSGILVEILDKLGEMPLPPYIHEKLENKDRYQTVYAKNLGSAAAPTAGLHFTPELLEKIKNKGVEVLYVTLHVGLGTFRPVEVDDVTSHKMHTEEYFMSETVANELNKAKKEGRRIISVGTTTVRVLETIYSKYNEFKECHDETNIFIYPGYTFKAVDAIITNFHLPKSTLLMLVSAFSSKEMILNAYEEAKTNDYRFFSFGDSMFITDGK